MARSTSSRSTGEPGVRAASGSCSTSSRIRGSWVKPTLTTSARPGDEVVPRQRLQGGRSHSTPAGGWKEPTRFLPAVCSRRSCRRRPRRPCRAASSGRARPGTPRSQVAATKPARSVVAPPPTDTTASLRVKPTWPRTSHRYPATLRSFCSSPSGTSTAIACVPPLSRSARTASAVSRSAAGCTTATRALPSTSAASSPSSPCPTTTSYGRSPVTEIRVGSLTAATLGRPPARRRPPRACARSCRRRRRRPPGTAASAAPAAASAARAGSARAPAARG